MADELLAGCPFCGATPHRGLTKVRTCQLHGELIRDYRIWCPHGCANIVKPNEALAIAAWNTRASPIAPAVTREDFAPCPFCHQYSHSIGEDQLAKAFMHFQSMYGHPVRGHPMGDVFDEQTRDAAQVLMAAARLAHSPSPVIEER